MADDTAEAEQVRITLDTDDGHPVVHILTSGGTSDTFKDKCLVVPEEMDEDHGIYAVLVDGKGRIIENADTGQAAIVPVPPMTLRYDDQAMITQATAATLAGVDRTTIYRAVRKGELETHMVAGRHPRMLKQDILDWINGKQQAS